MNWDFRKWPWWVWPLGSIAFWPLSQLANLNAERYIENHNLDRLYESPEWLKVVQFILHYAPAFAIGAAIGMIFWQWKIGITPKYDRKVLVVGAAEDTGISRLDLPVTRAEEAPVQIPDDWRSYYRRRGQLKIYEAACLAADVVPQNPPPPGTPFGYCEEIMDAVRIGKIVHDFGQPPFNVVIATAFNDHRAAVQKWRYEMVTPTLLVDRKQLMDYFLSIGDQTAFVRLGEYPKALSPPPQSPTSPEEETPQ